MDLYRATTMATAAIMFLAWYLSPQLFVTVFAFAIGSTVFAAFVKGWVQARDEIEERANYLGH